MRVSYTKEEALGLASVGKALISEKGVVVFEVHYPDYVWDERFKIYRLTCFVPAKDLKNDLR